MINKKALEATRDYARRTQPEINPAPEQFFTAPVIAAAIIAALLWAFVLLA